MHWSLRSFFSVAVLLLEAFSSNFYYIGATSTAMAMKAAPEKEEARVENIIKDQVTFDDDEEMIVIQSSKSRHSRSMLRGQLGSKDSISSSEMRSIRMDQEYVPFESTPNFTEGFNIDSEKWTFVAGEGFPEEDRIKDARLFKEMFESAQDQSMQIVRRVCPSCDDSHKDIYYRRLTTMPDDFDLLDTLMNNWFDTNNILDVDFALYSSHMDAYYDQNRWTFCNFNDPGIGFPRDCGPNGRVNYNWNSYGLHRKGQGRANHHAFLLPSNPSFNSQIVNIIADKKRATVKQSTVAYGGLAKRAVDGDTVGIWTWLSTTQTQTESNPWWQVTFDYNTAVDKVYFWNRVDCCRKRLSDVRVSLYQDGEEVDFIDIAGAAKVMNVVDFGGIFGDTVRISLPSGGILSLAEVQVVAPTKCLYQSDFDDGTLILSEPGHYKLCEDITFYPLVNPPETSSEGAANAFEPIFSGHYDENAFGLGFFAALCIATNDLTLDLNGHIIQQSEEHALLQRFFAVIELADSPFIKGVGPAQFVAESNEFNSASNISIIGPGTIGRSAHHGIHGNENDNVLITDVTFVDFEVAAVSLNKVDRLRIENCEIKQNRHNVPILGMFSAARFIRPYGKILKDAGFSMNLRGVPTSATDVYDRLVTSIKNVYDDVIQVGKINKDQHPTEYNLFHNEPGVVDGPCYAFLVNGRGPAVGDFRFDLNTTKASSRVTISNNTIQDIKCWTNEVPAIVEDNKVMNDVRGAVFQLTNGSSGSGIAINNDGTYKGNVVADMQIMVAKAINDGDIENTPQFQTAVNSLDSTIIDWASSSSIVYEPKYRCNGDSMHHVVKGMTVIRVDNTVGFRIKDNVVEQVTNLSPPSFDECNDYLKGPNNENADDSLQQGANIRGISVAAVSGYANEESWIKGNRMRNFFSDNADIMVGIDIQGKSDSISTEDNYINLNPSFGGDETDQFIALRVRQYSDSLDTNITIARNYFAQETQTVNVPITEPRSCPHSTNIVDPGSGCPFASRNRK